jgi:hypothetical protein
MRAACDLARWFGNEAVRIYASLAETHEQRELRNLVEFIQSRGGSATVRDGMTYFRPFRGNKEETERQYSALVRAKYGEWKPVERGGRSRRTQKFQLPGHHITQFGLLLERKGIPGVIALRVWKHAF